MTTGSADASTLPLEGPFNDLATGAVSKLCDFSDGQQVLCLHIPLPPAEDKAPAAPGFSISGNGGAMEAAYSIAMPSTLYDGSAADGDLTYSILTDGVETASGTAKCGETVTGTFEIAARGNHKFICTVSNSTGKSPKAKAEAFIGFGTPLAPGNVV